MAQPILFLKFTFLHIWHERNPIGFVLSAFQQRLHACLCENGIKFLREISTFQSVFHRKVEGYDTIFNITFSSNSITNETGLDCIMFWLRSLVSKRITVRSASYWLLTRSVLVGETPRPVLPLNRKPQVDGISISFVSIPFWFGDSVALDIEISGIQQSAWLW